MTHSSRLVTPLEIVPESWVMQRIQTGGGGLVVQHQFDALSELAVPGLSHHLIVSNVGEPGANQFTRFGRQEHHGVFPPGALWLALADNTACEWAWDTTDESILFQVDPLYLQQIAAENGCDHTTLLPLGSYG